MHSLLSKKMKEHFILVLENRHPDTVTANEAHSVVSLEKGVPDSVAFCSQLE